MTNRRRMEIGRSAADWMGVALPCAGAVLVALAFLSTSGAARATTYKWVDDKGVVHYSDKMPPEAINKGSVELNKEGIPVKKTEPAPTPEQLRAKAAEEERQRDLNRQQEEIARRDRALLSSYTSESEIDLARNRSLRTIESVVQSSKAYSEQLGRRKASIEAKRKTDYADKPMPAIVERELETINTELARQQELLTLKQKEVIAVNSKYDADKKRWRELIAAKGGEAAAVAGADFPAAASPVVAPAPKRQ
jgi:Domain of unknown function (DUF4124)